MSKCGNYGVCMVANLWNPEANMICDSLLRYDPHIR